MGWKGWAKRGGGLVGALVLAIGAGACGGSDDETAAREATTATTAEAAGLGKVKTYLLDHTARLSREVAGLRAGAERLYALAEASDFDHGRMLREKRAEARALVRDGQRSFAAANPAYEEMEGAVAGVPSLADFDVLIDAGGDASNPESAVPFSNHHAAGQDVQAAGQLQLPDRDLAVRHRAAVRGSRRAARSRRRRPRQASARRCPTPASTWPPRATSSAPSASSTLPPASGSRLCRTR